MTAKEQLRERVEQLTADEAAETLRLLDQRSDPVTRLLNDAPPNDEPIASDEEVAVQLGRERVAMGDTLTLEEFRADLPSLCASPARRRPRDPPGRLTSSSSRYESHCLSRRPLPLLFFFFFFFSREEERLHIHVQSADGEAKLWIEPEIKLARNYQLSDQDLSRVLQLVVDHEQEIRDAWHLHFGR